MIESDVYREDIELLAGKDRPWDMMSGRRVLVTGATGMIGSIVTDVLATASEEHGFDVVAMSRRRSELDRLFSCHSGNPRFHVMAHDVNVPMDTGCDTVFHLASNTHPKLYQSDPVGTINTNVIGLRNLLESVSGKEDPRFVFASSVEVYGQNRGDVEMFDERYCGYIDCNTVRAGYNEAKRLGEAMCQAYGSQYGVGFVIPRISRTYGPSLRGDDTKALSQFIHKAVSCEDIVLKSKGDQMFSYCYSADAADAILHLFFHGKDGEAYNVSGPEDSNIILRGLAEKLAAMAGKEVVFDLPDEVESRGYSTATKAILDTSKIRATGWAPGYGIDEGLSRTVSALASQ